VSLEVGPKGGVGLDGDDGAVVLPDVGEEAVDELAPLGWVGLCLSDEGSETSGR